MEGEFARKRRMMLGLWDIVVGDGWSPRGYPRLYAFEISPTGCCATRRPLLHIVLFIANLALLGDGWIYILAFVAQLAVLGAAVARRAHPGLLPLRDRPLLRDDHGLDRRRPLGPPPQRAHRALGEGGGHAMSDDSSTS